MVTLTDDKSDATLSGNNVVDQHNPPPDYSEAADTQSAHQDLPPAFSEPSGSSSTYPPSFSSIFAPLTQPTNYLTIEKQNSSIKGTYSIDPTLPAPPGVVKSRGADGRDLNLRLSSTNGSVSAVIDVIRGVDSKGPARLETSTKNGPIEITVLDRQQNRFRLQVTSENGSVNIRIPPTFVGSVYSKMENGRLRFHSEVRQHVTTFSELQKEGRHFIGNFAAHGYEDEETWHMDHLHVESKNGSVTISYSTDETKDKGKGFFSRFLSS